MPLSSNCWINVTSQAFLATGFSSHTPLEKSWTTFSSCLAPTFENISCIETPDTILDIGRDVFNLLTSGAIFVFFTIDTDLDNPLLTVNEDRLVNVEALVPLARGALLPLLLLNPLVRKWDRRTGVNLRSFSGVAKPTTAISIVSALIVVFETLSNSPADARSCCRSPCLNFPQTISSDVSLVSTPIGMAIRDTTYRE